MLSDSWIDGGSSSSFQRGCKWSGTGAVSSGASHRDACQLASTGATSAKEDGRFLSLINILPLSLSLSIPLLPSNYLFPNVLVFNIHCHSLSPFLPFSPPPTSYLTQWYFR